MGDTLEFSEVLQEVRGCMHPGRLKLQSANLIFKNNKTGKVDQFPSSDVDQTHWLIRARGQCLKVILKSGTTQRYDGFKDTDFDKLSEFVKEHYGTKLEKKDLSVKGWNWGIAKFVGNTMDFKVDGLTAFEIPLANISHSQTSKNEVTIEFHQNDDAAVSLMEMRFHIPSSSASSDVDPVAEFYTSVMAKADVIQATGDAITTLQDLQCLTPRGRYDIKIFPTFLQLHGKTFDYKIPYMSILRLFLLPHRDNRQMFFVVSLDPPIKQGQTRYHFLILLFNKETEITLDLSLSEEELEKKYEGKLSKEMSGLEYEIVSRLMKALVNKKITVPGSFVGHSGTNSLSCSYKAATGLLYPLERGFMFLHKPPLHIRFDETVFVNFGRSAGSNRTFDFDVETKAGVTYNFVGIEKEEYGKLYDFVTQKKLRVKNTGGKDPKAAPSYNDDMLGSDDDDDRDLYLERMKKEGKKIAEEDAGQDDDEDDQEDEDFKPEGSASEPDDEYDSNLESTTENSDEDEGGEKKKKEKKKRKSSSEGEGEEEEDMEGSDQEDRPAKKHKADKKSKSDKPKKKKKKKERDADQPKRAQSAYFLWLAEARPQLKEEFPGLSMIELTKKAGEKWKEVTDKSKWEEMAAKEKAIYEEAMAEYKKKPKKEVSSSPESSPKPKKSKPTAARKSTEPDGAYKSKEFISDEESSRGGSDAEEKQPAKKDKAKKGDAAEEEASSEEDDKPLKKADDKAAGKAKSKKKEESKAPRTRRARKEESGSESEVGELPDDEEILSSPEVSEKGDDDQEEASDKESAEESAEEESE